MKYCWFVFKENEAPSEAVTFFNGIDKPPVTPVEVPILDPLVVSCVFVVDFSVPRVVWPLFSKVSPISAVVANPLSTQASLPTVPLLPLEILTTAPKAWELLMVEGSFYYICTLVPKDLCLHMYI